MNKEILNTIITLTIGGILGGFLKTYFDFRKNIVSEIWGKRFDAYKKLWAISEVLPKWPKDNNVTYKNLYDTSNNLKRWYFQDGGILLSRKSREKYQQLQVNILNLAGDQIDKKITDEEYELIRNLFSTLRTKMTEDLTSRKRRLFK